jgi:hypothetical protein
MLLPVSRYTVQHDVLVYIMMISVLLPSEGISSMKTTFRLSQCCPSFLRLSKEPTRTYIYMHGAQGLLRGRPLSETRTAPSQKQERRFHASTIKPAAASTRLGAAPSTGRPSSTHPPGSGAGKTMNHLRRQLNIKLVLSLSHL